MKELTQNEVGNVRGAWGVSRAGLGALAGAAGYLGYAATSGTFSWGQLGVYTAGGALTGAIGGPVGVVRAYLCRERHSVLERLLAELARLVRLPTNSKTLEEHISVKFGSSLVVRGLRKLDCNGVGVAQ